LKSLQKINPHSPLLAEVALAEVATEGNANLLRKTALEVKKENPHRSTGDYFLAWAAHLRSDRKTTKWHLGKILAAYPHDIRSNFVLQQLNQQRALTSAKPVFLDLASSYPGIYFEFPPTDSKGGK